jgi:sulfur-oxidizing protein SoxX
MRTQLRLLATLAPLTLLAWPMAGPGAPAAAAPALSPYTVVTVNGIPTIPSPLTTKPGDPAAGRRVVIDRGLGNCLSCHEIGALRSEPFHGEVGPPLDGVASRWDGAALRMIVVDPKRVFGDDTVMPAFYRVDDLYRVRPEFLGKPILSAQQVEDVVAFLATMR